MGRLKPGKTETPEHRAARKARKREKRHADLGLDPAEILPIIIPGTRTAVNQLQQCRRWLLNEKERDDRRFSKNAIKEAFDMDFRPEIRASHPFSSLTYEAKQLIKTIENERGAAKAAGVNSDWWGGSRRKGVTPEMAKQYKAARQLMREKGLDMELMLGIESLGLGDFDQVGFEDDLEDGELEGLGEGDDEGKGGSQEVKVAPESEADGGGMEQDQEQGGEDEEALMEMLGEMQMAEEDGMDLD
ncbi:MAG: hypothetical protein LQ348_002465 [Seirophora lacunosa]|nr:MAG: hypothetical protein LQ348_002465 [Seirophora lacunosa]